MKKILITFLLLIVSIPVLFAQPDEFAFTPTSVNMGLIATVEVNAIPASGNDWIAAFDEDGNCAGAEQLLDYYGQALCNFQIYGDNLTTDDIDEGINAGETFTFKLWVAATGQFLNHPTNVPPVIGWTGGLGGSPVPGWYFTDGKVLNFNGPPLPDEDGDGFLAGLNDPDDNDPCNPSISVAACDIEPPPGNECSDPIPSSGTFNCSD